MKRILIASPLFASIGFFLAGCLKDDGFDNQEYGINDPDTQPPGVSFPFAAKAKNDVGLDVSASTQTINDLVFLRLEAGTPAASDVQVTLSITSPELVAAYNAANGTNFLVLDPSRFTVPLTITIPAGAMNVQVPLQVLNTIGLDPSRGYAIGLTISSVTNNYTIASNLKNLFVAFTIKNQYDGKYSLKGRFYHPSYPYYPFATTIEMHTTGPNSAKMFWPLAGDYGNPFSTNATGSSLVIFDLQDPDFVVNPTTNAVTAVNNVSAGAVTFYGLGGGFDNAGYNSRWDPATKTFYVCYGYNLGAAPNQFVVGSTRMWIDTMVRTGPR